jgi:RNA-splicing ligase RtcB
MKRLVHAVRAGKTSTRQRLWFAPCIFPPVKGTVIGFTATVADAVIPSVVGVDIGCGVCACNLRRGNVNTERFVKSINDLCVKQNHEPERALLSLGTLGGGNHFIEIDKDEESPMAYKRAKDILEYIGDTVEIEHRLKPLYNFKAVD